jgi:hypothetical protein
MEATNRGFFLLQHAVEARKLDLKPSSYYAMK